MRAKEKAYAKLNLALKAGAKNDGFHELDGIAVTVDLFDVVTVESRRDDKIVLNPAGLREYVYNCTPTEDNAYKAAKVFAEKYSVGGVNITVKKNIPLSGGMGGSSTDAAAVLKAMAKLYKIEDDLEPLANLLGSDTAYLLNGGFARLQGRGEVIKPLSVSQTLHFAVLYPEKGVNTAACFAEFDKNPSSELAVSDIDNLENYLCTLGGYYDFDEFSRNLQNCKNDLYPAAKSIEPAVGTAFEAVSSLSPSVTFMTGSGSTVCGIFPTEQLARWAVDKLKQSGFDAEYLRSVCLKRR